MTSRTCRLLPRDCGDYYECGRIVVNAHNVARAEIPKIASLFKRIISTQLRGQLVVSLVFPVLDYCCATRTDLTGQQRLFLRRLLNACVRFIFNLRRDEHITPRYSQLNWLAADERGDFLTCCSLFTIVRSGTPPYLAEHLKIRDGSARVGAAGLDLAVPFSRTTAFQRSFRVAALRHWNSIPPGVRRCETLATFKRELFAHMRAQSELGRHRAAPESRAAASQIT